MNANKFMTEYQRMCTTYERCADCPLSTDKPCSEIPSRYTKEFSAKLIKVVEDWSAANPITTRADVFKKLYPNAITDNYGTLHICPADLDRTFDCQMESECCECRRAYWSKEVQP